MKVCPQCHHTDLNTVDYCAVCGTKMKMRPSQENSSSNTQYAYLPYGQQIYQPPAESKGMFINIGKTLKTISKVCFYIVLICGALITFIGMCVFLSGIDEYTSFAEGLTCTLEDAVRYENLYAACYYGRQIFKFGIIMAVYSFCTLPLYGFGEIITLLRRNADKQDEIIKKLDSIKENKSATKPVLQDIESNLPKL